MSQEWIDRLQQAMHNERSHQHSLSGRVLMLALATLALIQFSVLESGQFEKNPTRFLAIASVGLGIGWIVVAPIPVLIASRSNEARGVLARIKRGWSQYPAVAIFAYMIAFLAGLAASHAAPPETGTKIGILILLACTVDLLGFTAMQVWTPHKVFLGLFPWRIVLGTMLAAASGIAGEGVAGLEWSLVLNPVLATVVSAVWLVWAYSVLMRKMSYTSSLADIRHAYAHDRLDDRTVERLYEAWLRAATAGAAPPDKASIDRAAAVTEEPVTGPARSAQQETA